MVSIRLKCIVFIIFSIILIVYGCGMHYVTKIPIDESIQYPTENYNKINLNVALLITDELNNAVMDAQYLDCSEEVPFGDQLKFNSIKLIE